MAKKIKVPGYSKITKYNRDIEYSEYSPDLVGLQLTNNGGNTLFTLGNFSVTTNLDPKETKFYSTSKYSNYYTIDELKVDEKKLDSIIEFNNKTILRLDQSNLKNHALFGSLSEYLRVTLEDIIITWPAALYINPVIASSLSFGNTVESYNYDSLNDIATFKVNTNLIINPFEINYVANGTLSETFNENNTIRNLTTNYNDFCVYFKQEEYKIVSFTGATEISNSYIYLTVNGNPFTGGTATNDIYHIKPIKKIVDMFFNSIDGLKKQLLNLETIPKYTTTFEYPEKTEDGNLLIRNKTVTWPVTDGYNLDFASGSYESYVGDLLSIVNNYDSNETSLVSRFFVSESISSFDTLPYHLDDQHLDTSTGQKVTKTLNIYGRSFDDVNKFIKGISFAHVVTYNKKNNMPDKYLKDLARVLGWELISTALGDDFINTFTNNSKSQYSGQSIGMTPSELDVELWRRLIINSPWIWKSKGARKSIEFLMRFMGIPNGLIKFNEYIYIADKPIDIDLFAQALSANGLEVDLSLYSVDFDGYPKPLPNTDDLCYQSDGLWYRQTGGINSDIDILLGNNPHAGPYDGGSKYINQFRTLIPNFTPVTVRTTTNVINSSNLFTNYNLGIINGYNGKTFIDIVDNVGNDLSKCYIYTSEIIEDPMPVQSSNICGCPTDSDDDALKVCVNKIKNSAQLSCSNVSDKVIDEDTGFYVFNVYNKDINNENTLTKHKTIFIDTECCKAIGGNSTYFESNWENGIENSNEYSMYTSGNICCSVNTKCGCNAGCKWYIKPYELTPTNTYVYGNILEPIEIPAKSGNKFLKFKTFYGYGKDIVASVDGSNCPSQYTIATKITDPFTKEVGFGCKLTQFGISDLSLGENSKLLKYFTGKLTNEIGCCEPIIING